MRRPISGRPVDSRFSIGELGKEFGDEVYVGAVQGYGAGLFDAAAGCFLGGPQPKTGSRVAQPVAVILWQSARSGLVLADRVI